MMEDVLALFIPIITVLVTGAIILYYIYGQNKIRESVIEKGILDEKVKFLFQKPEKPLTIRYKLKYLRWGLIILGFGIGLMIGFNLDRAYEAGELIATSILISVGIVLIIYFLIERKFESKEN